MKTMLPIFALVIAAAVPASASVREKPLLFLSSTTSAGGEVFERRSSSEKAAGGSERVSWESLSEYPWHPPGEVATIEGASMPAVALVVERSQAEETAPSNNHFSVSRYRLRGRLSGEDPLQGAKLEELSLVRVEIEGEGTLVRDSSGGDALAGAIRLVRRVTPSPWRKNSPVEPYEEAVESAWSKLP